MSTGIALYFADGQTYYLGLFLIALATLCYLVEGKGLHFAANVILLVGTTLIFLSSIPAPIWFYFLGTTALLIWIVSRGRLGTRFPRLRLACLIAVLAFCLLGTVMEWSHRRLPHLKGPPLPRLYVLGDSLSAGMGGPESTWPAMLAADHNLDVINLARPGGSTESALAQACGLKPGPALILIEIGGNDFFAGLPAADFERHLDTLLQKVHSPDRRLVMFELPIPLLGHGYGYAQRRLAHRYNVTLIPRQILARTIAEPGATLDGLHFSPQGHRRIADAVWSIVQNVVSPSPQKQPGSPSAPQ